MNKFTSMDLLSVYLAVHVTKLNLKYIIFSKYGMKGLNILKNLQNFDFNIDTDIFWINFYDILNRSNNSMEI